MTFISKSCTMTEEALGDDYAYWADFADGKQRDNAWKGDFPDTAKTLTLDALETDIVGRTIGTRTQSVSRTAGGLIEFAAAAEVSD